jgi:hypothetical protein
MCNSDMCQPYGLDFKSKKTSPHKTEIADYISSLLMPGYVAALCNMLAVIEKKVVLNTSYEAELNITSNLTIDKKANTMINVGMLDELLQEPFKTCDDEKLCKSEVVVDDYDSEKIVSPPEHDINKTPDVDPSVENIILDSEPIVSSDDGKPSIDDVRSTEVINSNDTPETIDEEQPVSDNTNIITDGISVLNGEKSNDTNATSNSGQTSNVLNHSGEDMNNSPDQLALDNLLNDFEQGSEFSTPPPTQNSMIPPAQGQKESVFLRLSNRVKVIVF